MVRRTRLAFRPGRGLPRQPGLVRRGRGASCARGLGQRCTRRWHSWWKATG